MSNYTPEQLQAAKAAKSPEELVTMAKEQGYEITLERAAAFLKQGELADEELDNVAGGSCSGGGGQGKVAAVDHGAYYIINWNANEKMNNIWYYVDREAARFTSWGVNVEHLKRKIEEESAQSLGTGMRYHAKYNGGARIHNTGKYEVAKGVWFH